MRKSSLWILPALLLSVVIGVPAAHADILTYTETTTASGSLDGTAFSNELVTITLTGDTAGVLNPLPGIFALVDPVTVAVGGVGSDTFTDQIQVVANQGSTDGGFGDKTTGFAILFNINSGFSTYGLTTPIGPLSGSSLINPGETSATTGGTFDMTSAGDATFTAVESTTTTATPEPSSLLLLSGGLAGLGFMKRRELQS